MKQVDNEYLLNVSYEEYNTLGYFDSCLVDRAWEEAGRIKGLPYGEEADSAIYGDITDKYGEDGVLAFRKWLKEEGATYYSAPHEDFFIFKAVAKCLKEGNKLVYVEDMS